MEKINCSVTILTRNNEKTLEQCLASVSFCDDIVVLDGNSTDRTREIAEKFGARIFPQYENAEPNVVIKNFTELRKKSFDLAKNKWVFYVDSDEYLSPELQQEIQRIVKANDPHVVGFFDRHPIVEGKEIRHAYFLPDWCARLIHRDGGVHWKDGAVVHETFVYPTTITKMCLKGILHSYWLNFQETQKKDDYYIGLSEEKFTRGVEYALWSQFLFMVAKNTVRAGVIFFKILWQHLRFASFQVLPFRFHMRFVKYHLRMAWSLKKWRLMIECARNSIPRSLKIILVCALALRITFFVVLLVTLGQNALVYGPNGDAVEYVTIAKNIVGGNGYSLQEIAPFLVDPTRTPGYPLILLIFGVGMNIYWITALAQIIISVILVGLVYGFSLSWIGKRGALIAAAFTAFEPNMVYYPLQLISETFFTFGFFVMILLWVRFVRVKNRISLIFAMFILGIITYIRPVVLPLVYLAPCVVTLFIRFSTGSWRKTLSTALISIGIAGAIIIPWSTRNYIVFENFDFSSVFAAKGSVGKYLTAYTQFRFQKTPLEKYPELNETENAITHGKLWISKTTSSFVHDPLPFVYIAALNAVPWMVGDGWYTITKTFIPASSVPVAALYWNGNPSNLFEFIRHAITTRGSIFVIVHGLYAAISIAMVVGIIRLSRATSERSRRMMCWCVMVLFYFVVISGVESYARFRYPATPFIYILVGACFMKYDKSTT